MSGRFDKMFGIGGIGTGIFFQLDDNRPLSRDESRAAVLTDFKDYCKGHIILHYVATLSSMVRVCMIGMVGNDELGRGLVNEMQAAGIDTKYVVFTDKAPTMFSVCYQFPDSAGGNLTSSNSACDLVTAQYIEECVAEIDENSIVLAAPEVSLASRIRLLEIAKKRGAFTIASFLSAEAEEFMQAGGFKLADLITINADEARAVSNDSFTKAAEIITFANPVIKLAITDGARGSHLYENGVYSHLPCNPAEKVLSTAGAGDAFLGGLTAGIIAGKSFVNAAKYGAEAARLCIDTIICVGQDSEATYEGAYNEFRGGGSNSQIIYFGSKNDCIAQLPNFVKAGDTILVKASRGMRFEDIVSKLVND